MTIADKFPSHLLLALLTSLVISGCSEEPEIVDAAPTGLADTAPQPSQITRQYSIDELMSSVTYRGLSLSPDGSRIATSSNASGIYNIVEASVDDGRLSAITDSTVDSNILIGYFPGDDRILFSADQGGNEMHRIYVREVDGTIRNLTPDDGMFMTYFQGWAGDGKSFYISSNKRDMRHFDLYKISVEDYTEEMVYQNDDLYFLGPVSPDGQTLVLEKAADNRSRSISLHDLNFWGRGKITPSDLHIANHAQAFSPDGKSLYYTTDKWHEFQYLVRYDIETAEHVEVLKLEWDIRAGLGNNTAIDFSEDGRRMAISSNRDARTVVDVYDVESMQRIGGSDTANASIASWELSGDGNTLGYIVTNGRVPGDIHIRNIESGESRRLVSSIGQNIEPDDLVAGEVARFSSYDGLTVPGVLYKPQAASAENKVPALIWVHGGPGGETRIGYDPLIQYLVSHGYAVYGVNNRGSSGNGKTFFHLDDQDHGGSDLADVIASRQYMIDTGWVIPEQVGVIGQSYGGFLILAAMAFHPGEFDVAVDIFGVANWVNTIGNLPPWWEARRQMLLAEMGDFSDEVHWRARSPIFQAGNITKPLIVLQGANDPRVPKQESDKMVAEVQKNGTPVEYVVFDDEGHGFRKKKNQVTGYTAIVEFLNKYLKGLESG